MAASKERNINEYNSGLTLQVELDALDKMIIDDWRLRVDQNLQYFTREYVLEENITRYSYGLKRDKNGIPYQVYSPGFEDEGDVINSFRKGVGERAQVEYVGFEKIEQKIFQGGAEGNFFVWVSPPGKAEDGFKDHNFTFVGHVLDDRIDMIAYKNWLSRAENARFLNRYLPDLKQLDEKAQDLDFLANPVFLKGGERFKNLMGVVHVLDPQRSDLKEEDNRWFLDKLNPFRKTVILALETGDLAGAERAKTAHDNYAVALLRGQDNDVDSLDYWAAQPAVTLQGSCGFSRSKRTISTWFGVEKSYFNCPRCDGKIESGKGITVCPHCGVRKEDCGPSICD
ncbi:MAG: hypothetical protein M1142_03695 [Patescibacteria group bacterium]|nr:hypothetical protein [Patescibacteria group bacterium]